MNQDLLKEIIHRSRNNDADAFRRLVEGHYSFVFSLSFRLLCNHDDAKDAAQETFIRVWKHLTRYDDRVKFTTWLYKIAVNICYDRLKSMKRNSNHMAGSAEIQQLLVQPSADNPENTLINNDLAQIVRFFTDSLTPKQKLVFTLSDLEQMEVNEIKEITGLSPAKIKSNLYLARKFIREKLEEEEKYGTV